MMKVDLKSTKKILGQVHDESVKWKVVFTASFGSVDERHESGS